MSDCIILKVGKYVQSSFFAGSERIKFIHHDHHGRPILGCPPPSLHTGSECGNAMPLFHRLRYKRATLFEILAHKTPCGGGFGNY